MNRIEYNKLHYEAQRQKHEALMRFKASNPERYAELMAQAQAEVNAPSKEREVIRHSPVIASHLRLGLPLDIDKVYHSGERHFHCLTSDRHLFPWVAPVGSSLATLDELTRAYRARNTFGSLAKVAQCDCPACRTRDLAEGTTHDYTDVDELLGEYFESRRE